MFEKLKSFCDSLVEMGLPGLDLVLYKDGECVLRYMKGCNDLENKIPMNGKERYNIYSCSKPITCTAALKLYEKGLYSLDDKLSDYMPEFSEMTVRTENGIVPAKNPILVKHLFEMTAGFSYDLNSPELKKCREETEGRCQTREAMKYLAREPLCFEPGDRWNYSLCHDVLAAFVEVVSGEKFEDYVKKNIFDVVGMNDSTFLLPEDELDTIAGQYRYADGKHINVGKRNTGYRIGTEYASGGAGAVSTVDDYIKFLEGLRTYKLLKKETLDLMCTHRLSEHQNRTYTSSTTHGYGLGVRCPDGIQGHDDFGWGGAAGAYLAVGREHGISMYMGTHLHCSPVQGMRSMLYRIARAELVDESDFAEIQKRLKELHNYSFTY